MAELVVGIDTSEKLPDGYTRLEYLRSVNGAQWIVDSTLTTMVSGSYEIAVSNLTQLCRFVGFCNGVETTAGDGYTTQCCIATSNYIPDPTSTYFPISYQNNGWNDDSTNKVNIVQENILKYEFHQGEQKLYVNGVLNKQGNVATLPTGSYPFRLFRVGDNVYGITFNGSSSIHYCKVYNANGELIRNYIPCKNSSNVLGMYELVTNRFLTNKGSGTFTAGPEYIPNIQYARVPALVIEKAQQRKYQLLDRVKDDSNNEIGTVSGFFTKNVEGHDLPDTYQELEYVELNHAYIDTGIVLDTAEKINTAKIHFTAANLPLSSGNTFAESGHSNHLFGCNEEIDGVNYDLEFFTGGDSSGEYCYGIRYGTTVANQWMINYPRNSQDFNPNIIPRFLNKYRFDIDNLQMSITDVNTGTVLGTDTASSVSFGFTNELRINGQNRYPSTDPWYAESYNIARIYDLEIEGIAHMVPAKRNSDNVVGMYDIIRDQFYTQTSTTGYSTAAVAGPYVIPDNMEYAVVCLDSTNRATGQSLFNNYTTKMVGIPTLSLTDNTDTIYSLSQTATENTNAILATATSTGSISAVANYVRSKSFVIDGNTYYGQIPNAVELLDIYTNRSAINSLDSSGNINNSYGCHSSTQIICGGSGSIVGRYSHIFILPWGGLNGNWWDNTATTLNSASIYTIPVLEIPNIIE